MLFTFFLLLFIRFKKRLNKALIISEIWNVIACFSCWLIVGVVSSQSSPKLWGWGQQKTYVQMAQDLGSAPPVHDTGQQDGATESTEQLELLEVVGAPLPHGLGYHGWDQDAKVQKGAKLSRLRDGASLSQVQQQSSEPGLR